MSLNTTPRTWVAGEVVTASHLNTEVRDAITGIQAAWSSYTPSWTAATSNPTLGNGTLVGAWSRVGKTVLGFRVVITMGTTTTYGSGQWLLTAPSAPINSGRVSSTVDLLDNGVAQRLGRLVNANSAVGQLLTLGTTAGGADRPVGAADPHAWGSTDQLCVTGASYELP